MAATLAAVWKPKSADVWLRFCAANAWQLVKAARRMHAKVPCGPAILCSDKAVAMLQQVYTMHGIQSDWSAMLHAD